MKNIAQPKSDDFKGPWLLSEETLTKIDSLMEKAFIDFNALAEEQNEKKSYSIIKKSLSIWFDDDKAVDFESFREAIVSDSISNQKPVKFEYVSQVSSNRLNINLNANTDNLEYYINCEDESIRNNLCYDMQKIYSAEKPKLFFSIASVFRGFSFVFYILIFLVTALIMSNHLDDPFMNTKEKVHQILLKDDLQQEDYFEIIRYSMIINYKFYDLAIPNNPNNLAKIYNKILYNYLIIGFIICLIITTTPKPSFAVGKGKKKVAFWNGYYKFLLKFLPIGILLPIAINFISYLITNNIK
jgi:hypothetical protein